MHPDVFWQTKVHLDFLRTLLTGKPQDQMAQTDEWTATSSRANEVFESFQMGHWSAFLMCACVSTCFRGVIGLQRLLLAVRQPPAKLWSLQSGREEEEEGGSREKSM